MNKFNAFFKENAKPKIDKIDFVVSDRFLDEDGNEIPFVLRYLNPKEITTIQNSGLVTDKKGKVEFKADVMQLNLVVATISEPDLLDAEFQKSYGVTNPHDLINEMLTSEEYMKLLAKCMIMQGMSKNINDYIEEAKN